MRIYIIYFFLFGFVYSPKLVLWTYSVAQKKERTNKLGENLSLEEIFFLKQK